MRRYASPRAWLIPALGLVGALVAVGPPVAADAGRDALAGAVRIQFRAWYERSVPAGHRVAGVGMAGERLIAEPKRLSRDGRWAFGGGVDVPSGVAGGEPVAALFLAHRDGRGWRVAVQGSTAFAALARTAPASVIRPQERAVFAETAGSAGTAGTAGTAGNAVPEAGTGLALPWARRQAWGGGQVHGDSGASRPFNAVDFYGGDGKVRASAAGRLYRLCAGSAWPMLLVVHDNGWTTGYYHTRDQTTVPDGSAVTAGQYLGTIGVELPCGGETTTGPHVHWTLWRSGNPVAVDGQTIGGWTFHEGPSPYGGYAEHAGIRVNAWDCCHLINYGPS